MGRTLAISKGTPKIAIISISVKYVVRLLMSWGLSIRSRLASSSRVRRVYRRWRSGIRLIEEGRRGFAATGFWYLREFFENGVVEE
jgi:hypothetical protein